MQVELSWSGPFLQQAVLCTWQRQSISSQGSCLCALKLCFSAPEGTAFPMSLVLQVACDKVLSPLVSLGPALCWGNERLSGSVLAQAERELPCPAHEQGSPAPVTELHLADFSYLINMCNHWFFSQIKFYLDDEGSCKLGTLPHEFTRLPFI